ncbi:MAG: RdgB/HAM1 family non-canonical purine NTP pyrophosphatase [Fimbriimonas sp.]|nr:RdgB/HAM1 family non-canonical purine NTP pyrophosphatase [Fimbriimonas sp.]
MSDLPFSTLVIATHNRKKAGEMITILGGRFPELSLATLADYDNAPEPDETGKDYPSNATIKSESAADFTGEWSLADDAGLEIDFLDGAPGLYSKRFGGEELPFPEKIELILEKMSGVPTNHRGARFRCCVALTPPFRMGPTKVFTAVCEGRIAEAPSGGGGFGYDPIFYLPELQCTMADLAAEQKHRISHRGKVLAQVAQYIDAGCRTL